MKKLVAVLMIVGLVVGLGGVAKAGVIADSVAEFHTGPGVLPVQGSDNWYYGVWKSPANVTVADPADYDYTTDFTYDDPPAWDPAHNFIFLWYDSGALSAMYADGGLPHGLGCYLPQRGARWPIRRWVAEVTGSVLISGELGLTVNRQTGDPTTNSNGFIARILNNGVEIYNEQVPAYQPIITYSGLFDVTAGDLIDFMVDPDGPAEHDWTIFTIVIEEAVVIPEPAGLGLLGLVLVALRRKRS